MFHTLYRTTRGANYLPICFSLAVETEVAKKELAELIVSKSPLKCRNKQPCDRE